MDQFVEMMRAAQGGHALENLARVYGLSGQQAQAVTEAMMPAFAEAFRHATQSPEALASLMALMSSGPYGGFYSQPAAPAELSRVGTEALDTVFGSSDVSRAVAAQVAATTGLGVAIVKQMMPSYATLVVGGLAKSLAASGALQQMMAAMLSRMPGQTEQRIAPISTGNPWIDAFLAFTSTAAETAPRAYSSGNPWADAFAQMMFQRAAPAPAPQRNPANAWQDVVNAMAKTMAQAGGAPPRAPAQPPEPPPPPLMPFQRFFAQLFAQGFPPAVPGAEGGRTAYGVPEFWMDMMKSSSPQNVQEAETLPPEKPRLVKPQADGQTAPAKPSGRQDSK